MFIKPLLLTINDCIAEMNGKTIYYYNHCYIFGGTKTVVTDVRKFCELTILPSIFIFETRINPRPLEWDRSRARVLTVFSNDIDRRGVAIIAGWYVVSGVRFQYVPYSGARAKNSGAVKYDIY